MADFKHRRDRGIVRFSGELNLSAAVDLVETVDLLTSVYFYDLIEIQISSLGGVSTALEHFLAAHERWRAAGVRVALHHAPAAHAHVLHHAPVAVLLAVFESLLAAHEHAPIVRLNKRQINRVGRHYRRYWGELGVQDSSNSITWVVEKSENRQNSR